MEPNGHFRMDSPKSKSEQNEFGESKANYDDTEHKKNDYQLPTIESTMIQSNGNSIKENIELKTNNSLEMEEIKLSMNGQENGHKDFLALPRSGHRLSFMEQESVKDKLRISLLKQCSAILKQNESKYTRESLHRTFQDEDLTEKIYSLFDTDHEGFLGQQQWIEYLKQRLTEEKQIQLIEELETSAYELCGDDDITPDKFQMIFKKKAVSDRLFKVVDHDGDGLITAEDIMEFISAVSSSRSRAGFDKYSVDRLEQLFKETVGDQKEITREQFQKIVVSKNPFFTERVFQIFDEDDSGSISLQEFISAAHSFAGQTPEDKIRFLFKVYDLDGDGLIQHRELQHVMRACMEENGMQFSEEQLAELTSAMFEDADTEDRGAITYDALKNQLQKHEGLLENLSISIDRWLIPPKQEEKKTFLQRLLSYKRHKFTKHYFKNNYVLVSYIFAFFLVNFILFVSRVVQYWDSNVYVILARACGQCLNLDCAWVVVPMLRVVLTSVQTRLLDHHHYIHRLTATTLLPLALVHTVMHLLNFSTVVSQSPQMNPSNYSTAEWIFTSRPGVFGLVPGCANPTGVALVVVLAVIAACSQPCVRRGGCFEIFYWTHLLYIPFWLLMIFHGPNFWKWFLIPGSAYIIERILRLSWLSSDRGRTYISSGVLLPSRVVHLVVKRPPLLHLRAGDFLFVCIPAIAHYEWHPFTVSSAPEQKDYIWLHIRAVGEWTNRLYSYFENEQKRLQGNNSKHQGASRTISSQSCKSGLNTPSSRPAKRSVDFSPESYTNDGYSSDENKGFDEKPSEVIIEENSPVNLAPIMPVPPITPVSPLRLQLEKSYSMPDVKNKLKSKERLMTLRNYSRWESERALVPAPKAAVVPATPAVRGAAHSFRYMRTKPTIIAFKTPSFDTYERDSIITAARRRLSKSISPDKDAETAKEDQRGEEANRGHLDNYPAGKPLEIFLDGPYGAPSSHIFLSQHAALIAAGIGVTPFASILQSIMYRYWASRRTCPACQHSWTSTDVHDNMTLRKVDFFWINREQRSFEWFVSLLSQLEIEQAELGGNNDRFLDMHMYITSALQKTDMKAVGLQLALDLLHEKEKRDLITGLKTRTNAGRPNWDKVFKQLQEQKKGKVTVFYCGPPQLARILRAKCNQYGFDFRKEIF